MRPSKQINLGGLQMLNINITVISDFIKYFEHRKLEEKAIERRFIKRNDGKLTASTFVKAFTIGLWGSHHSSLQQISQLCEDIQEGLNITKQALHQRLKSGVELMKEMLNCAIEYSLKYSATIHKSGVFLQFKNTYICDGTYVSLPNKLKQFYRGTGGIRKKEAALKIQTMFNITTRSLRDLRIYEACDPNGYYHENILSILQENDLIIHDLGYFKKEFFKQVSEKGAYYLSRLLSRTLFYSSMDTPQQTPLPLNKIFKQTSNFIDTQVCIGGNKKKRLPVRIIAVKLPKNIVEQRLRKANIRSRGKTMSKIQKTLIAWNIVVTNAPVDKLTAEAAMELYKIRWQIELVYKAWKSHAGLCGIAHGGKEQMECMLYGRLVIITLMTTVFSQYYFLMLIGKGRELSILRFFSHIRCKAMVILDYLNNHKYSITKILTIFERSTSKSLYEKRRRKTALEALMMSDATFLEYCG